MDSLAGSTALSEQDRGLIRAAREILTVRFREGYHHVGAALRTCTGEMFSAVHLEANVGRIAVCAEAVALGMAAAVGDTDVETVVAVGSDGRVVSPCGMCRELISDYAPQARVIVPGENDPFVTPVSALLPNKYLQTS